jgi:hypothetical protein
MKPPSHKGVGRIGRDAALPPVFAQPAHAANEAWRYSRAVSESSATSVFALASRSANTALSRQIELAVDVGRVMREQSLELERTAQCSVPAGPWRDMLMQFAEGNTRVADAIVAQALQWGRRFGGLAFAFPLPDRSH